MSAETPTRLQRVLAGGSFAVTAECGPPRGADVEAIRKKIAVLNGYVDAVNVPDNQTAVVRMSSIAGCVHLLNAGIEPVMQMVCRDRNRIALQSDVFGAYSLGIRNLLCLSGDHQSFGSQPDAMNVFDIDSMQLIRTVRDMRENGHDMSGTQLKTAPKMFIGAAANPFADPFEFRVLRLAKKIEAGADFIQTQCVFNLERFREWMQRARDQGLTEKVHILAGVTPLKSVSAAKYIAGKVPGMDVPEKVIRRMAGVPAKEVPGEGIRMCVETIAELREIEGVHGIHIMAIEWEEKVGEIVEGARLYPRPAMD
ncbi:MAG: methylenetetrahydrofolate reductase [Deltaproteobacteria bacterium]|nr:methylenetetrahydrofolate reductase [Deltaproteobacteria bacterium]